MVAQIVDDRLTEQPRQLFWAVELLAGAFLADRFSSGTSAPGDG